MGVRRAAEREVHDFYRTPPVCTEKLLQVERFERDVWEPACGDGAISQVLEAAGHTVFSTDLIDRGYGESGFNFLAWREPAAATIITNPPFKLADEFVLHSLALGVTKVAMLLRLAWLEGARRHTKVFAGHAPSRVWVFSKRPTLWNGSDPDARTSGGAIAYAWFVWDAAAPAGTVLGWIP